MIEIKEAQLEDIPLIAPLFDNYRQFYRQKSDLKGAYSFLSERLKAKDSLIYIAFKDGAAVGFTQLYFLFSSVSMQPMYLLNDLYVVEASRKQGVATSLIDTVKKRCVKERQKGIALQTETTNPAQKLYESLGFIKDPDLYYFWKTA